MVPGVVDADQSRLLSSSNRVVRGVSPRSELKESESVAIFFKCKEDCRTVFTAENFKKIMNFQNKLTAHPLWAKICF
jgi:hypothetical protein